MNIEALCAAAPEALTTRAKCQMPFLAFRRSKMTRATTSTVVVVVAAAVVVTSLARGGESGGKVIKSFEPAPQVSK